MKADTSRRRFAEEQGREKLLLLMQGQWRVLEMIASPVPLATVLEELARVVEEQVDGLTFSVLQLSEDRAHLRVCTGPSLPERYRRAIDGLEIEGCAGSCGTAAFQGQSAIVTDIANDPPWPPHYKELALDAGFKACWSTPIVSGTGEVLAILSLYHRQPLAPTPIHLSLIGLATHLAQIAIERGIAERERHRLEDARRLAEWYRMVLQATGEALWDWDLASGVLTWSSGLAGFGYESGSEDRTLKWWIERLHPQDTERIRRSLDRAVESGQVRWEEEYRFRRMDGSFADVIDRGVFIRDQAGRALRMVGSLQDITVRRRREEAMEQLAERFRAATAAAAVGTWRLDLKEKLFFVDESLNLLLRGQEGEAVLTFDEVMRAVHPADREQVGCAIDEAVASGRPYHCDHRVVLADGEVRWLRGRGRVLCDLNGRPQGMTGAMSDFTELKHAEQSMAILAEASRLLTESLDSGQILATVTRMAVPSFSDAVVIHLKDPQTSEPRLAFIHAANPELDAAIQEMQRTGAYRVAAPSRRVMRTGRAELHPRLTPEWLLAQDVDENLASLIRKFRISSTLHVPIMWAEQPFAVIVFAATETRVYNDRDLAFGEELARRASGALRNAELFESARIERKRAEEAAALRERLVAVVGHDLRNPLAAIRIAAQSLGGVSPSSSEKQLAGRIQSSADRMRRMVDQILDFARIRSGHSFDLHLEPADLKQVAKEVVDELRLSRSDKELVLDFRGRLDVTCDADRIAQVLSNLIGNAIQHGRGGAISVTLSEATPDSVAIEVHNIGPPIPGAAQRRIFDAFHSETTEDGSASTSIGLGLFIASEIVRAQGGSIAVRSPDRGGTTFTVVLPRKPAIHGSTTMEPAPPQLH